MIPSLKFLDILLTCFPAWSQTWHSTNLASSDISCVVGQANLVQLMQPLLKTTPVLQICAVVRDCVQGFKQLRLQKSLNVSVKFGETIWNICCIELFFNYFCL